MNSPHELSQLIEALRLLRREPAPRAALATLTRTHGSTFRRPGTHMLVLANGDIVCELSGGCPQRDIVLRAQEVIASGEPRLVHYNSQSSLDVLMEMGCGGELEILLEPLDAPAATEFAEALAQCMSARHTARLATVFAMDGVAQMPRRLLWCEDHPGHQAIDDPLLAEAATAACRSHLSRSAQTLQLPCAQGLADVLIEPIEPPHALVVIGSSAAARALLPLSTALGWQTTLVDHDPARLRAQSLPPGLQTVCAEPDTLSTALVLDRYTSVVVITHHFERDMAWLAALRDTPVAYVGTLGSRERVGRMRHAPALERLHLHAPAGLDIGSETPEEIALAVAAEIMAVINGRGGGPLRDNEGAIH